MPLVTQAELVKMAIAGQVVSFPTDTVPALAVQPEQGGLIYELKRRQATKPLILMAATIDAIWPYLGGNARERTVWQGLMERHWPGALTLVLPASAMLPVAINPLQNQTIGVRIPNLTIAREILQATGPLATTSANVSGQPPLTKLGAIAQAFPAVACLNCLGLEKEQPVGQGLPSTVAQWQPETERFTVLRQGAIALDA